MIRLYGQAMQIERFKEFICGLNTQLGHFKYYNDSKSNRKLRVTRDCGTRKLPIALKIQCLQIKFVEILIRCHQLQAEIKLSYLWESL